MTVPAGTPGQRSLLKLGTRGSELALFQAHTVADLLRQRAGVTCEIVVIKTSGDRLQDAPLSEIGGKRLFVKEIEDALLGGSVDLAVHSSKDMPAVQPEGLTIGAVLAREDPRDAIVLPAGSGIRGRGAVDDVVRELGSSPRIGTSSIRRIAQLQRFLPGASFLPIRGNLDTRLRKLDTGSYDAIVLAAAGLRRLQQEARISAYLATDVCVPAPGQGIIAVEIRSGDASTAASVVTLNEPLAAVALAAERAVVTRLGGGCQMPIGAFADVDGDDLVLSAIVIAPDGSRAARAEATGRFADAASVGRKAADLLLERGAADILAEVERLHANVEGLQP